MIYLTTISDCIVVVVFSGILLLILGSFADSCKGLLNSFYERRVSTIQKKYNIVIRDRIRYCIPWHLLSKFTEREISIVYLIAENFHNTEQLKKAYRSFSENPPENKPNDV